MSDGPAPDLARDRPESPFARILSSFVEVHGGVIAAAFVDREGECVDYASRIDPFEAQVVGAQLAAVSAEVAEGLSRLQSGALILWVLEAERREFVVRRVTDEHWVAVALAPRAVSGRLLRSMPALAEALRRESGFSAPGWDPWGATFEVTVRPSSGWGYAPSAFRQAGEPARPVDVLGRWTEPGSIDAKEVVCFRVRAQHEELTLSHDRSLDRWYRR